MGKNNKSDLAKWFKKLKSLAALRVKVLIPIGYDVRVGFVFVFPRAAVRADGHYKNTLVPETCQFTTYRSRKPMDLFRHPRGADTVVHSRRVGENAYLCLSVLVARQAQRGV